jgi:hypothetical protein
MPGRERLMSSKITYLVIGLSLSLHMACNNAYSFCFDEAGIQYGINPLVLRSIAKVESNFDPAAINLNSNGTFDKGLMQINSIWRSALGNERWNALDDECYNTKTGAWILANCIEKYGYNWKAIGCYHSRTPDKSEEYAKIVFKRLKQLENSQKEESSRELREKLKAVINEEVDETITRMQKGEGKTFKKKFVPYKKVSRATRLKPPPLPAKVSLSVSDKDMTDGIIKTDGISKKEK